MTVFLDGAKLDGISDFIRNRYPEAIRTAQVLSTNDTARKSLVLGKQRILKETAFPQDYLDEPQRFYISQYANKTVVEAHVSGRSRPTSLLRFALGNPTPASTLGTRGKRGSGGGIQVEVNPGQVRDLPGAFVISLNGGNYGIAISLKKGVPAFFKSKKFYAQEAERHGYYILYGPSVDQVWRTVAQDILPQVATAYQDEFKRQLAVQLSR